MYIIILSSSCRNSGSCSCCCSHSISISISNIYNISSAAAIAAAAAAAVVVVVVVVQLRVAVLAVLSILLLIVAIVLAIAAIVVVACFISLEACRMKSWRVSSSTKRTFRSSTLWHVSRTWPSLTLYLSDNATENGFLSVSFISCSYFLLKNENMFYDVYNILYHVILCYLTMQVLCCGSLAQNKIFELLNFSARFLTVNIHIWNVFALMRYPAENI